MLNKVVDFILGVITGGAVLYALALDHQNTVLREHLEEPVNCEAVCEVLFEEMGC